MRRFRRVFGYFLRHRRDLALGSLGLVFASALDLAVPLLVKRGLDRLGRDPLLSLLAWTAAAVVAVTAAKGFFRFWQRRLLIGVSRKVEADLKRDLFRHLVTLSFSFFNRTRTGDLLSRATADVEAVRLFLGPGSMYAATTLLLAPAALVVMFHFHPLLALLVAVPLGALAWTMKRITPRMNRHSQAVQDRLADLSNRAQENFAGARVVKGFHREDWETGRFAEVCDDYRRHQLLLGRARGLSHAALWGAKDAAALLIFLVGGLGALRGTFTIGGIYLFLDFTHRLFWPLIALGWMVGMYHRAAAGMDRIEAIFSTKPEIADEPGAVAPEAVAGDVEVRNLRFAYDGEPVLRGVSLRARPGEVVGIVGRIGSGKTTLLSLLGRLFPVPPGAILVDGTDLNRLPVRELRASIGFVPQDHFLFSDTLRENVAFGFDEAVPDERIERSLETASFGADLAGMPAGLDTVLGERGVTLSGGQRQRVAIARALLREPRILVLDDALSSVDTETETAILRNLRAAAAGRTVFVVAHRLSAVEHADRIAVLDGGRIVEEGTHGDLLARGGWYARTWRRQRLEGEVERL